MQIEIITDLEKAEQLWAQFVISDNWYNQWELRKLFHQNIKKSTPLFYVATEKNQPIAILPLQISSSDQKIEFFGSGFFEGNQAWANNDQVKNALYQKVTGNVFLDSIEPIDKNCSPRITLGDQKFILPIKKYQTIDQYLEGFSSKRRNNLRRAFKKLDQSNLQIVRGDKNNLNTLFELNIKRFGTDSVFTDPHRQYCFEKMLELDNHWEIILFKINNKVEAVSLSTLYDNTYLYHNAGTNLADYPNLGNMVIYQNIKKAIELKADIFDAGSEDLGWKSRWHLEPIQLYMLSY